MGIRFTAVLGIAAAALAATRAAHADTAPSFDELAARATALPTAHLVGLAWLVTAACEDGDDLARRQCRAVRDGRLAQLRARPLLLDGDPTAFTAGDWDYDRSALPLTLRGCIACAGVDLDGTRFHIVAAPPDPAAAASTIPPPPGAPGPDGGVVIAGNQVQAAVVHAAARSFHDEASALRWRTEVLPRLRTQLVVQLTSHRPWSRDGRHGVALALVGYRVHDPCTGVVVLASPPAASTEAVKSACGAAVLEGRARAAAAVQLPVALTPSHVREALRPATIAADRCHDTYGVAGEARFRITIAGDGAIVDLAQDGDFADTPTGACIDKAVRAIRFPATQKARTTVVYPIVLR